MGHQLRMALGLIVLASLSGCGYAGVAAVGPDKVVIAKDNNFLFGAFRRVYVCKVTDNGVRDCREEESP